jgi:MFS family permease
MPRMRGPQVLALTQFRYYFAAQAVSAFGSAMATIAITFAILRLGGSASDLGLVLGASMVPSVVLMLFGGVAGDRWERRRILFMADLTMCLVQATLAVLLLTGRAEVWNFLVAGLVTGAAGAFTGPAGVGIYPSLVPTDRIQEGKSLLTMAENVANILGPPAAGILVATASPGWALGVDAASFLASAVLLRRLPRSRGAMVAGLSVWADVKTGWTEFASRPWVWLMVLSFATYQASVLPAIYVLGPVFAEDHLGGAKSWALVLSARAVGALLVGPILLRWRPRRPLVASTALILLDVPFLATLALGLPLPVVIGTGAVSSAGLIAADTLWESTFQTRVPADVLSRVSSYESLGSQSINPLGLALIGVVAGAFGAAPVLFAALLSQVVVRGALILSRPIRSIVRDDPSVTNPKTDLDGQPTAPGGAGQNAAT